MMKLLSFGSIISIPLLFINSIHGIEPDIPQTILGGGQRFPLVGLGVGNLQHDRIVAQVTESIKYGNRLIDTAHASKNEHLIRQGVQEGITLFDLGLDLEIHVITKVWYTYLGYERTKIAVSEILEELKHPNIRVHILVHWPRCRDDIPWMKCEEEENSLPQMVKDAGPAPHLDKENAFKESWRALEDIFLGDVSLGGSLSKIESIGVSNFGLNDLKALEETARVVPHILQDNVWNFNFNPFLVTYCREHDIHFQAYNVMNGIFSRTESSPTALSHLSTVSSELRDRAESPILNNEVSVHQLILKWLIQSDVSVIPRTSSVRHVQHNSASVLALLPDLSDQEITSIDDCVNVMLKQEDLDQPMATFHNKHHDTLHIFWSNEDGEEFLVKDELKPGEKFHTKTYPGHKFVAYDKSREQKKTFTVGAAYGEEEEFHVEL